MGPSPRCFRRFLRSGGQRTAPQPLCQADFRVSLERGSGKRRLCGTSAPLEEPREGSERGGSSWRRWLGRRRLEQEEAAQEDLYLEARPEPRGSASVSLPGRREGSPTTHTGACRVCEACPGRGGAPLGAEGRAGLLTQAGGWRSSDPARFNSQDCCLLRWGR